MKDFYYTYIPVGIMIILTILFSRIPYGADLISAPGDFYLGGILGVMFPIALFLDFKKHSINKELNKTK